MHILKIHYLDLSSYLRTNIFSILSLLAEIFVVRNNCIPRCHCIFVSKRRQLINKMYSLVILLFSVNSIKSFDFLNRFAFFHVIGPLT